jgi:hypothetical protein
VVGGSVQGWWLAARGAGRSYTMARCSGCGRGDRRGARAGCPWWLSDGEQGGAGVVKVTEEEKVSPGGGGGFIAARGGGRGGGNGGRRGGGSGAVGMAWRRWPLSEGSQRGPDAVGPWFRRGG